MTRGRGTLISIAFVVLVTVWAAVKLVRLWLGALVEYVIAEVRKARTASPKPIAPDKHGNSPHLMIHVRPEDGPVVEAPNIKTPLPLSRVPVRSTKSDLERGLIAIAKKHSGKPNMTAFQARKYIKQLVRENPDMEIAIPNSNVMVGVVASMKQTNPQEPSK